ncbi:unnamed protein product [Closterium sp. Yama58-4]|nr:unnamed protein product [Closterium sp. Yama58-4]
MSPLPPNPRRHSLPSHHHLSPRRRLSLSTPLSPLPPIPANTTTSHPAVATPSNPAATPSYPTAASSPIPPLPLPPIPPLPLPPIPPSPLPPLRRRLSLLPAVASPSSPPSPLPPLRRRLSLLPAVVSLSSPRSHLATGARAQARVRASGIRGVPRSLGKPLAGEWFSGPGICLVSAIGFLS